MLISTSIYLFFLFGNSNINLFFTSFKESTGEVEGLRYKSSIYCTLGYGSAQTSGFAIMTLI